MTTPREEINYFVVWTALFIVVLTIVLIWSGSVWILAQPTDFHTVYGFAGNTVTLLSGLGELLCALFLVLMFTGSWLLNNLSVRQLSWLYPKHKWVKELDSETQDNLQCFLVEVHRASRREGYTDTGLETILTPAQFVAGTKLPKSFVTKTIGDILIKHLDSSFYLRTFKRLTLRLGSNVSSKSLSTVLLIIAIRGGYAPGEAEFNAAWLYVLGLIPQNKLVPRALTDPEKGSILDIWTDYILPVNEVTSSYISNSDSNCTLQELYTGIKSTLVR